MNLEIKSIISTDLEYGKPHWEPDNCALLIEIEIGEKGNKAADIFYCTAITTKFLSENPENRWGRGYLILEEFNWKTVESFLNNLLNFVKKDTWEEVAAELCKELNWEYENYQE